MATPDYTGENVMDGAASLMNDTAKTVYTFVAQLPYLNIAMQELKEHFMQNNIPVTQQTSAEIEVDAGVESIGFNFSPQPELPDDLVSIQQLWERIRGTNPWVPMTKVDFLPHYLEGTQINQFIYWAWIRNEIKVLPASGDNDLKIDYICDPFSVITSNNMSAAIGIINGKTFLQFRTAGLIARFIGENPTRATELDGFAGLAIDRVTGIEVKAKQSMPVRRKPFRASLRSRGVR